MSIRCFNICSHAVIHLRISNSLRRHYHGYKTWHVMVIGESYVCSQLTSSSLVVSMTLLRSVKYVVSYVKIPSGHYLKKNLISNVVKTLLKNVKCNANISD